MLSKLLASALISFVLSAHAIAADIRVLESEESSSSGQRLIKLTGDITEGDQHAMRRALQGAPSNPLVLLSSDGGLIKPALEIGRMLREANATTVAGNTCASACGLIWLAGRSLYVFSDAQVGFHAAFLGDAQRSITGSGNALVGAYLAELGYNDNVVNYVTEAAPEQMQWLSPRDARLLGLSITDLGSSTNEPEIEPASPEVAYTPEADINAARGFLYELIDAHTKQPWEVIQFVEKYYAPRVSYYSKEETLQSVLEDKRNYLERWPQRYTDVRDSSVNLECNNDVCTMTGLYDWSVISPARGKRASGTATFAYGLVLRPQIKVLYENGEVVDRD